MDVFQSLENGRDVFLTSEEILGRQHIGEMLSCFGSHWNRVFFFLEGGLWGEEVSGRKGSSKEKKKRRKDICQVCSRKGLFSYLLYCILVSFAF